MTTEEILYGVLCSVDKSVCSPKPIVTSRQLDPLASIHSFVRRLLAHMKRAASKKVPPIVSVSPYELEVSFESRGIFSWLVNPYSKKDQIFVRILCALIYNRSSNGSSNKSSNRCKGEKCTDSSSNLVVGR